MHTQECKLLPLYYMSNNSKLVQRNNAFSTIVLVGFICIVTALVKITMMRHPDDEGICKG